VNQLINVTAVKIYVLIRSREPTPGYTDTKTYTLGSTTMGPFNDGFKRHVYVTTVRLPNISGRRQTP
jgi:type IV pilus assembly protein PilW